MKIKTPDQLISVLKDIRTKVESNDLIPQEEKDNYWEIPSLVQIIKFNWPDIIENYYIEKSSDKLFKLECETYHGAGGVFEEIWF